MPARTRRRAVMATVAAATAAAALPALPSSASADPFLDPPLSLISAVGTAPAPGWSDGTSLYIEGPVYVATGVSAIEFWTRRATYSTPEHTTMRVWENGKRRDVDVPKSLMAGFSGLGNLYDATLKDASGTVISTFKGDMTCLNSWQYTPLSPLAPQKNPYPSQCAGGSPFTRAFVMGLPRHSASQLPLYFSSTKPFRKGQRYTVTVSVSKGWRSYLGLTPQQSTVTAPIRIAYDGRGGEGTVPNEKAKAAASAADAGSQVAAAGRPAGQAAAGVPGTPGPASAVPAKARPDLRALPAFGMSIVKGDGNEDEGFGGIKGHEYLSFGATVYNAGPSPLVVDGFRRPGKDLMDAYQSFYDVSGRRVGYVKTGEMEYDQRVGHEHWHFLDFAVYNLLADGKEIVRSGKEAFCLAPTDGIDLSVPGAQWRPESTGLDSACGSAGAVSIRESLPAGWGDTYLQDRPGQSFDITSLPNGRYQVQVLANPEHRLHEGSLANNEARRTIELGGTKGSRTVKVLPYGLVPGEDGVTPPFGMR